MKTLGILILCISATLSSGDEFKDPIHTAVARDYLMNLESLFIDFHQHPELAFQENRTAARLAREFQSLGLEVHTGIGQTGVAAVLRNGPGPVVMLRAELDALPLEEKTGLPYASTVRGLDENGHQHHIMHACGHDAHLTCLVGAARILHQMRDQWSGTLLLIGQPAEEKAFAELGYGAYAMVQDSLYDRVPVPDAAFALHVIPDEAGSITVPLSVSHASSDEVDITVYGIGTHSGFPDSGVNPITIAADLIKKLEDLNQQIPYDRLGIVTVGTIHGGRQRNIIPETVKLEVTVRTGDSETRQTLFNQIVSASKAIGEQHDLPESLWPKINRPALGHRPLQVNDTETAQTLAQQFSAHFGPEQIRTRNHCVAAAEDFGYLLPKNKKIRNVYFEIGGIDPKRLPDAAPNHSPDFFVDPEKTIRTGVEALVIAAINEFKTAR